MSKYFPWVVSLDIFFRGCFLGFGGGVLGGCFLGGDDSRRGSARFPGAFDFTSLHFLVRLHADVINFMLLNSLLRE